MRQVLALPALLLLALIPGCGGGGDAGMGGSPAAAATALETRMQAFVPMIANVETSLVFVLNPGTPLAQGVSVVSDTSPGAAPHSVRFSGPFDGNGDGINETTMSGRATFNSDPAAGWSGATGQVALDVSIPIIGHVYRADVAFTLLGDERRLSGTGRFTEPISGNTTTMTVDAGAPLVIRPATDAAGSVSNACAYNVVGRMRLEVSSASGVLASNWDFSSGSTSVAVSGAVFTDSGGMATTLPDSSVNMRCGSSGSVNDWVATFDQNWACLPRESGQARITISSNNATTIGISDEDPPGSGNINVHQATVIGANPHALRGFFISGPVGNRYREDFNWTLGKNGSGFSQFSTYSYIEGPNQGTGGICVASARRRP